MAEKYRRVLRRLSKRLTKLSDQELFDSHKRVMNNFICGDNASIYIIQLIESELKHRGICNFPTKLKLQKLQE
jgi:NADH:ubiquinone oxidoreductase subunit F (NADH-binding)